MLTIVLPGQAYKQAIAKEQDTVKRERAESMAGGGGYDDVRVFCCALGIQRDWVET
jgi:hypothetical protein